MSSEAVTHRLKQMEGLWLLGTALRKVKVVSKGAGKKNRGLEIQAAIRDVLFTQWNPISLADDRIGEEYDAYIAPLYRILVTSRDQELIIDTLMRIERDEIGTIFSDSNKLRSVANSLLGLKVTLD
jgi:hypothetical protein